jgi:type IX secretion system PorP/SprF family membrane protein
MRKYILVIVVLSFAADIHCQQIPPLSQYMYNHYFINPAATGISDDLPLSFAYRKIWAGISSSPSIQYLSANMNVAKSMGAGVNIFNFQAGPLRKTGLELTYSYHLELNSETKLAFGLSGLIYQFHLKKSELTIEDSNDPIFSGEDKMIIPDASFGTYLYGNNYFVGLSVPQLFNRNIDLKSDNILQEKQVRHYYLFGGYNFEINQDLVLKPSLMLKFIEAGLFQVDINTQLHYKDAFIFGLSFRSSDAVVFQVGFKYEELLFGYSYDLTISGLNVSTFGSHEIYLQYILPNFLD